MKRHTQLHTAGIAPFTTVQQLDSVTFTVRELTTLREAHAILDKARDIIEFEDEYTDWAHAESWLGAIVRELDRHKGEWPVGSWGE